MTKRALVIGICKYAGANALRGCVNDANAFKALFRTKGYTISSLLDTQATKANILAALANQIKVSKSGDVLAVTFSLCRALLFPSPSLSMLRPSLS